VVASGRQEGGLRGELRAAVGVWPSQAPPHRGCA